MTKPKTPPNYATPVNTGHAYKFGVAGGRGGYPRLSRAEFLVTSDHPFPTSLYRAYRVGFKVGREMRASEVEAA